MAKILPPLLEGSLPAFCLFAIARATQSFSIAPGPLPILSPVFKKDYLVFNRCYLSPSPPYIPLYPPL